MPELRELAQILDRRFHQHLDAIAPGTPAHRVEFSRRITESWALIYYRRNLVRLSPYLFLLDPHDLKHDSHWDELDATLRHEAAHAATFHACGHTGHGRPFHERISRLGLRPNGACDLGPENAAFRYVYACPTCDAEWPRRTRLRGNWSCGACGPGGFHAEHRLVLRAERHLASTLRQRREWIERALADGRAALAEGNVMREASQSEACAGSSS